MALTLKIKDKEYSFRFGFAFLRAINPLHRQMVEELNEFEEIGFQLEVVKWLGSNDYEGLVNILWYANKTESPRLDRKDIEEHIEGLSAEELEELETTVKDFLSGTALLSKRMKSAVQAAERATEATEQ